MKTLVKEIYSNPASFDNKKVDKKEELVYILLNKPLGYVTTSKDQFSRDSVLDLVKVKYKCIAFAVTFSVNVIYCGYIL